MATGRRAERLETLHSTMQTGEPTPLPGGRQLRGVGVEGGTLRFKHSRLAQQLPPDRAFKRSVPALAGWEGTPLLGPLCQLLEDQMGSDWLPLKAQLLTALYTEYPGWWRQPLASDTAAALPGPLRRAITSAVPSVLARIAPGLQPPPAAYEAPSPRPLRPLRRESGGAGAR